MDRRVSPLILTGLLLAGCDQGRVTLSIEDAPIDEATSVIIEFSGVELESTGEGTQSVAFDPPLRLDLLAVPAGQPALLLDRELLPVGDYTSIRLLVNAVQGETDSVIQLDDGGVHSLRIPAADVSGLTLTRSFEVANANPLRFTIDFNLRESIEPPPTGEDDYLLRPVLRLLDDAEAGRTAGIVAASRIDAGCAPAVYVFDGAGIDPDDVDPVAAEVDPLTSARVELDDFDGFFRYTTPPLLAGDYTLAFTCEADLDDPATNDDIAFPVVLDTSVEAGQTTTANFN